MLAGLSKWPILRIPPCFCADAVPMDGNSALAVASTRRSRFVFVRLLFVTRAEKTRIAAVPALFGSRAGGNVREVITYRIRGTGARYRHSIAFVAGPPCRKGLLVEPEVFEARAAHSRAFR